MNTITRLVAVLYRIHWPICISPLFIHMFYFSALAFSFFRLVWLQPKLLTLANYQNYQRKIFQRTMYTRIKRTAILAWLFLLCHHSAVRCVKSCSLASPFRTKNSRIFPQYCVQRNIAITRASLVGQVVAVTSRIHRVFAAQPLSACSLYTAAALYLQHQRAAHCL